MADALTAEQVREINQQLKDKNEQGFLINNVVLRELDKMPQREKDNLIRWWASEDGNPDLKALHHVNHSETRSLMEWARIRRNYNNRRPLDTFDVAANRSETDRQLQQRLEDIRAGRRRR